MSDDLGFKLTVDSRDFDIKLGNAGKLIQMFGRQANASGAGTKRFETSLLGIGNAAQNTIVSLGMLGNALHTLKFAFVGWQNTILESAGKLERLQVMLKGIATESDKVGQAQREMNYLLDSARNAPFSLDAISNSFIKMKTVGIEPATGSMQAMMDSIARFGGDDELFKRASIAIQQMMGKGVVSMEELRQQLGEAVPDAMQRMADSMGMTMGQFTRLVSSGTVRAKKAIEGMMLEFQMANAGASKAMMDTYAGAMSQLKTSMQIFAKAMGDTGYLDVAKGVLRDLTAFFSSQQALHWGKQFSEVMTSLISGLKSTLTWINENGAALKELGKTLLGIMVAQRVFGMLAISIAGFTGAVATMAAGVTKVGMAFVALKASIAAIPALVTLLTTNIASMGMLAGIIHSVRAAFNALTAAMSVNLIIGAITAITAVCYTLWEWFGRIEKKAQDAANRIREIPESMTQADEKLMEQNLRAKEKELEKLAERIHAVDGSTIGGMFSYQKDAQLKDLLDKQAQVAEEIISQREALEVGQRARARKETEKTHQLEMEDIQDQTIVLSNTYRDQAEKLRAEREKIAADVSLNDEQRKAANEKVNEQHRETAQSFFAQNIDLYSAYRDTLRNQLKSIEGQLASTGITEAMRRQFEAQKIVLNRAVGDIGTILDDYQEKMAQAANLASGPDLLSGHKEGALAGKLRTMADNLEVQAAGSVAKMDGVGRNVARAKAELEQLMRDSGGKDLTTDERKEWDRILANASKLDGVDSAREAEQESKRREAEAKRLSAEQERLRAATQRALDTGDRFTTTMGYGISNLAKYDIELRKVRGDLEAIANADLSKGIVSAQQAAEASRQLAIINKQNDTYRRELEEKGAQDLIDKWAPFSNMVIDGARKSTAELRQEFNIRADDAEAALRRQLESEELTAYQRKLVQQQLDDFMANRQSAMVQAAGTASERLLADYTDVASQIDDAVGSVFENLTDQLMDFCDTGKLNFADFGNFIFKEMQRIFIQSQIVAPIMSGMGVGSSGAGMTGGGIMSGVSSAWGAITGSGSGGEGDAASKAAADALKGTADAAADTTAAMGDLQQNGIFASITAFGQQIWAWITGSTIKNAENAATISATTAEMTHTGAVVGATMALNAFSAALTQAAITSATTSAFADGGIMSAAGSLPLKMYAKGGIATEPQLALFGEGAHNEAFVPLPDGRSIPVSFKDAPGRAGGSDASGAGADGGVHINIDVVYQGGEVKEKTDEQGEAKQWNSMAQRVKSIVMETIVAEKRNGGMLADA